MKFSVVIPSARAGRDLAMALASIAAAELPTCSFEVIVVDNSARQCVVSEWDDFDAGFSFPLRLIGEPRPGLHMARHAGLKAARAAVVAFIDDDVEVGDSWLKAVESFAEEDAAVLTGPVKPRWEVIPPDWLEAWASHNVFGYLSLIDLPETVRRASPDNVFGCNMTLRKSAVYDAGGFRPDSLPPGQLKFRGDGESGVLRAMAHRGEALVYEPRALVYHRIPSKRMGLRFLMRRSFSQGVSDSFSSLRARYEHVSAIGAPEATAVLRCDALIPLKALARSVKAAVLSSDKTMAQRGRVIALAGAHASGWGWHRLECARDERLRWFVLRSDFYETPEIAAGPDVTMDSQPRNDAPRLLFVSTTRDMTVSPSAVALIRGWCDAGNVASVVSPRPRGPLAERWPLAVHAAYSPYFESGPVGLNFAALCVTAIREAAYANLPHVVVGDSQKAVAIAMAVAGILRVQFAYLALEVAGRRGVLGGLLAVCESVAVRHASVVVSQDQTRLGLLERATHSRPRKALFLPNAPPLAGRPPNGSTYLRDRWGLPAGSVIVLSAGEFSGGRAIELAQAARDWPRDWVLVLHGWSGDSSYLDALRVACEGGPVVLSEGKLSADEYDSLVASASIGLALYDPQGDENVLTMASASGKAWHYLRCGLPVIASDFASLRDWVDGGGFGLTVADASQVRQAVNVILSDYAAYSASAQDYYSQHGDFSRNVAPIVRTLLSTV